MGEEFITYTYIIPLHVKDELIFTALRSLQRFENTTAIIACNEETWKWIEENNKEGFEYHCITNEKTSYASLVNTAIKDMQDRKVKTDFVSILEFDDTVKPGAHKAIEPWLNKEADIFIPLAAMVTGTAPAEGETPNLGMVAMLNEAPLATGISEEYGVLDTTMLLKANFAFVNGMYIRPSVFTEYGVFKEKFEILNDYEWILRMLYLGVVPLTIPRIARFHFYREDSEFHRQKNLDPVYREKWLNLVKREYLFNEDRDLSE